MVTKFLKNLNKKTLKKNQMKILTFKQLDRVKIPKELDFVGGGKNDRFDKKVKSLDFNKNNLKFLNHL